MKNRTLLLAAGVLVLATAGSGCLGRAVKEGLGAATGAKGTWTVLQPITEDPQGKPLAAYQRFELGELKDAQNIAPPEFKSYLPEDFEKELAARKLPNTPGGKTLTVRGTILYYEDAKLVGQALGPLEEVVARIELVDKDTGKVIGLANCVGRTQESVNTGTRKKAEGLAKAIAGWIAKNHPKATKEE